MSNIRNIFAVMIMAAAFLACSGQKDSGALPQLRADMSELDLAKNDHVAFKVMLDGRDVTASSVITVGEEQLDGAVFAPQESGLYTFTAEYDGRVSEQVTIMVYNSDPDVESQFAKRVCVTEFTGAWCVNCPEGYDDMMGILSKPSLAKHKDRISFLAFHSNVEGVDTLAISNTQDVIGLFPKVAQGGYPAFAVDFKEGASGQLTGSGLTLLSDSLLESLKTEYPVCTGVSLASTLSADSKSAEVSVKVKTDYSNPYYLVVLVIQDRIAGYQKTTVYPEGTGNYIHNHVVRKVVTSYVNTFAGEKITEDGFIKAGDEVSADFTVDVDSRWVLENTKIYALVMNCNGEVDNMNLCPIDGGNSGYEYKE